MEFTCLEGAGQSFAATGQPSEVGFKMMNLGGEVQNGIAYIIATDRGISQVNQSNDNCSLAASHDTSQKATHPKGVYSYEGSPCIPLEKAGCWKEALRRT